MLAIIVTLLGVTTFVAIIGAMHRPPQFSGHE
jgi:hypothetical protein